MSGTVKYVNLITGPGGEGIPPGSAVGDLLQWNGSEWVNVQPDDIFTSQAPPSVYYPAENGATGATITAGHKLQSITLRNAEQFAVTVRLGITDEGSEIMGDYEIPAEGHVDIHVGRVFSFTSSTSIYLYTPADLTDGGFIMYVETKQFTQ